MSNEVSIFKQGGTLPAHLQNQESNSALITSGESLPRISIKGFQFTLRSAKGTVPLAPKGQHLDVVILAVDPPNKNVGKAYFVSSYSGDGDGDKPDCSSANGVTPDHWIEKPQCTACASCPQNVWGAKTNAKGNQIKPCADHKRLIVVPRDNVGGDIAVVQVPPTSLKNLSNFGRELVKHHAAMTGVVTRLSFDQTSEYPKLEFTPVDFLDEASATAAYERSKSAELQDQLHAAAEPEQLPVTAAAELLEAPAEAPAQAAPKLQMTAKAGEITYEAFMAQGSWTDELLVEHGYAEYV
jgi:hypothetical protein